MKRLLLVLLFLSFSITAADRIGEEFKLKSRLEKKMIKGFRKAIFAEFDFRIKHFNDNRNNVDFFLKGFIKDSDREYMREYFNKVGFHSFSKFKITKDMAYVTIGENYIGMRPDLMIKGQVILNGRVIKLNVGKTAKQTIQNLKKTIAPLIIGKKEVSLLKLLTNFLIKEASAEQSAIESNYTRGELFKSPLLGKPLILKRKSGQTDKELLPTDSVMASVLMFSLYFDHEHTLTKDENEVRRLKSVSKRESFDLNRGGGQLITDPNLFFGDIKESILFDNLKVLNQRISTLHGRCAVEKMIMEGTLPESVMKQENHAMPLLSEIVEHVEAPNLLGSRGDRGLTDKIKKSFYYFGYNNKDDGEYNFCTDEVNFEHINNLKPSRRDTDETLAAKKEALYKMNGLICKEFKKLHSCLIDYMSRNRNRNTGRSVFSTDHFVDDILNLPAENGSSFYNR